MSEGLSDYVAYLEKKIANDLKDLEQLQREGKYCKDKEFSLYIANVALQRRIHLETTKENLA
jgi:hypothetical protein